MSARRRPTPCSTRGIERELILVDLNQPQRAEAHAQDLSDAAPTCRETDDHLHPRGQRLRRCRYRVITVSGGAAPARAGWMNLTSTAKIVKSIVPTMMANGFNGIFC